MSENHSQHEANKALRVLSGKPLKFTCRVHLPDGKVVEFQSNGVPIVGYDTDLRQPWVRAKAGIDGYELYPVMPWPDGAVLLCEENPKE